MNNEQFTQEYKAIVKKALAQSELSRKEGLLALEGSIDKEKFVKRDVYEVGLAFIVDARESSFVEKVLTNLVNLETDAEKKVLKTIQKEAVLAIQNGMAPHLLKILLGSYANIDIEESMSGYFHS